MRRLYEAPAIGPGKSAITKEPLESHAGGRMGDPGFCNEFLRTVLDGLNDKVLIIDADTYRIRDANEPFLSAYGLSLDKVIGRTCYEITHKSPERCSPPDNLCPLLETIRTGRFSSAEHMHYDEKGRKIYAEVSTSPIKASDGSIRQVVHVTRDITERKLAEEALRKSEERYKNLFNLTLDGVFRVNAEGFFTMMNTSGAAIFGYETPEEIIGKNALEFWRDPGDREIYRAELRIQKNVGAYPMKAKTRYGEPIELESSSRILEDESGNFLGIEGILRDVTRRRQAEEELKNLAVMDELTGLNNRRGFLILATQQIKIADRAKRGAVAVFADMNKMKFINDTFGHKEGDRALVDLANVLRNSFRSSDIIARWGGDEFVCLALESAVNAEEVIRKRLNENLEAHNLVRNRPYRLSVSFGLTRYNPENPCALEELLERGDRLMYGQKQGRQ